MLRSLQPPEALSGRSIHVRGELIEPEAPLAVVLIAHQQSMPRADAQDGGLARMLAMAGMAVWSFDLLDRREARDEAKRFDIDLLTDRFLEAIRWIKARPWLGQLPMGLFATDTAVAGALRATALEGEGVRAIVCCGGRPDLAIGQACHCRTAVLHIVAAQDERLVALNAMTLPRFGATKQLEIVEGASPSFQEPGALGAVAFLAESWFVEHLGSGRKTPTELN